MAFSVTCSICGRQFVGIDDALMGQQAKCKCGESVTLDPLWNDGEGKIQVVAKAATGKKKSSRKRTGSKRASSSDSRPPSKQRRKQKAGSQQEQRPTDKATPERKIRSQEPVSKGAPGVKPRNKKAVQANPATMKATGRKRSKTRHQAEKDTPAAVAGNRGASQDRSQTEVSAELPIPATFDTFDIDEILAGGVDTSPLRSSPARPEADALSDKKIDEVGELEPGTTRPLGTLGIAGAVLAGLSGLAAAALLLITRFTSFAGTPLGWVGQAFFGAYNGSFGSGEMSDRSIGLFMGTGWGLTLLSVLIAIISLFLLARVGFRIAVGRHMFAWARPALATMAVICLFGLLGLLFVQSIHHGELLHGLLDFAGEPLEGLLPDATNDEPFKEIRDQYKQENQEFMIGVATFAVLPLLAFGGAVVSLFFGEE